MAPPSAGWPPAPPDNGFPAAPPEGRPEAPPVVDRPPAASPALPPASGPFAPLAPAAPPLAEPPAELALSAPAAPAPLPPPWPVSLTDEPAAPSEHAKVPSTTNAGSKLGRPHLLAVATARGRGARGRGASIPRCSRTQRAKETRGSGSCMRAKNVLVAPNLGWIEPRPDVPICAEGWTGARKAKAPGSQ